jgi:hypothetical protein
MNFAVKMPIELRMQAPVRRCTKCGEVKLSTEYYTKSGMCKPCHRQASKEWRLKNPEKMRGYLKAWHARHRPSRPIKEKPPIPEVELTKICQQCKVRKPITDFWFFGGTSRQWAKSRTKCKVCSSESYKIPTGTLQNVELKSCTKCGVQKPLYEYSKQKSGDRGRYPQCKDCVSIAQKVKYSRDTYLQKTYGISAEQFAQLMEKQNCECAACLRKFTTKGLRRPVLHHDHITGFILDLLCNGCNLAESYFGTAAIAFRLAEYMQKNEPTLFPKHQVN